VTGLLWLCGHDPNHALVEAASFGRDADTIASVLGGIVGALHGASALRPDWIQECEQANAAFFAEAGHSTSSFNVTAARLFDALQSELDKPTNARRHCSASSPDEQARPIEPWTFVKGKMPLVKEAPHMATLSGRATRIKDGELLRSDDCSSNAAKL
jgi:hypothetical protein